MASYIRSGRKVFPIGGESSKVVSQVGNIVDTGNFKNPQRGKIYSPDGVSPALNCCGGGGLEPKIVLQDRYGVLIRNATKQGYLEAFPGDGIDLENLSSKTRRGRVQPQSCQTLNTSDTKGVLTQDYRIRKLTSKECWRLQGWNDEDFEKAAKVCSDSQLYKQAGNGVTVSVIYEIAKRL